MKRFWFRSDRPRSLLFASSILEIVNWYDNGVIPSFHTMQKVMISLEEDILRFVDRNANGNRSAYINALLNEYRKLKLHEEIVRALQEDVSDPNYRAEIEAWDSVIGDGIDAEG
jgi:hypothetical protein